MSGSPSFQRTRTIQGAAIAMAGTALVIAALSQKDPVVISEPTEPFNSNAVCGENGAICSGALVKQFIATGQLGKLIGDTMTSEGVDPNAENIKTKMDLLFQNMDGASEFPEQVRGDNFVVVKGPAVREENQNLAKSSVHGLYMAFSAVRGSLESKDCRFYEVQYRGADLVAIPTIPQVLTQPKMIRSGFHSLAVPACSKHLTQLGATMANDAKLQLGT
jgi:hypothetical protein